jgi:hypothetical protein
MNNIETLNFLDTRSIYYVYLHRRLDNNSVFYVGKGKGRRAWNKSSRNAHWKRIVKKHGRSVEILFSSLTEEQAFEIEMQEIQKYGLNNLANMTLGGVSTTGYKHTEDSKKIMREAFQKRLCENPGLRDELIAQIKIQVEKQKSDPLYYERLSEIQKARYAAMTEEEKELDKLRKTSWLKDTEKVQKAVEKRSENYTEEYRKSMSDKIKESWLKIDKEKNRQLRKDMYRERSESGANRKLIDAVSNKVLVNGVYLFDSQRAFAKHINRTAAAYSAAKTTCIKKYPFVIFSGYVIEIFDKNLHRNFTTDYSQMKEILEPITNLDKVLLRSDNKVYWGPTHAAKSFENYTQSTADWIVKCCKNGKAAMGYNWKFLTEQEVVDHVLLIIRNKGNESVN